MPPKKNQTLRVHVYAPTAAVHTPNSAYPPFSGLPSSAIRPMFFGSHDSSPLYTPLSAAMPCYPKTPLIPGYPQTPLGSDCPLDLNAPFELSHKYQKDFDNFFSTKLFRQNGDVNSKVLPLPKPLPSSKQAFFKQDRLPPIETTMLSMRDFEKEKEQHYTTTTSENESDSSISSTEPVITFSSPPVKKIAFKPYKVHKSKPTKKPQLAVVKVESNSDKEMTPPSESPFGRGMAKSENGTSNVERLKANPDMWAQATQVKKGVYVCTHCPSHLGRFRKLSELAAHFDQNNLIRMCKCDYPDCAWSIVGFSSRSEKTRHIKSQHATAQYECMHCERVFARSDSLKRHFKLIHNLPRVTPEELLHMRSKGGAERVCVEEKMPPPSSTNVFVVDVGVSVETTN